MAQDLNLASIDISLSRTFLPSPDLFPPRAFCTVRAAVH